MISPDSSKEPSTSRASRDDEYQQQLFQLPCHYPLPQPQPEPLRPAESSQGAHTGIQLRFPWGTRVVETVEGNPVFTSRELSYLSWVFRGDVPMCLTKANHLLFTALPRSYYPGKLIRAGRSKRARRLKWPTLGRI